MSEQILANEAQNADLEKIVKIKKALDTIKNKKSKFLFCIPESEGPTASVYELFFHATVVKNMGYDVIILTERGDYVPPVWIEKELTEFKYVSMADPKLNVGPEDIMVIPEVYSNIMEQTKNLPCLRIGILQSVDYMMNSLIPGTDWKSFNINDIITTSETLKEWIETFQGKNKFDVKVYDIGIPGYFERSETPQKPIISVVGRNPNEISKLVKLFFSRFPQYSWVTFDPMLTKSKPPQQMRRVDFAKRLQENFAAVWIDRIASFGTFPLECIKSGVIPICLKPDIAPEYILERTSGSTVVKIADGAGLWTDNFYDLPIMIGEALVKFLDDAIPDEVYTAMKKIGEKYTQENSEKQLTEIYQGYINARISLFETALGTTAPITEVPQQIPVDNSTPPSDPPAHPIEVQPSEGATQINDVPPTIPGPRVDDDMPPANPAPRN